MSQPPTIIPQSENHSKAETTEEEARAILRELQHLLESIYADMAVPRSRVKATADRGRDLAATTYLWGGGDREVAEFLEVLTKLEGQIHEAIDLQKLKEAGLVKAVKF